MFQVILLNTTISNSLITALTLIIFLFILILGKGITKKINDSNNKWSFLMVYFLEFIAFVGMVLFLLWLWGVELSELFDDYLDSFFSAIDQSVSRIISTALIIFTYIFILRVVKVSIKKIASRKGRNERRRKTVGKLITSMTRYFLAILAILLILAVWGINVGPALAGLGILGLVIGLGAQALIHDIISGFFIIFEHHFDVGDLIESNGFTGEVIDVGIKTTKLKNWKGEVKILSNGMITDVVNFSLNPLIAVIDFRIAYSENIEHVIELLRNELPKTRNLYPDMIEDPQVLGVISLSASSVDMRVIAKTINGSNFHIERQLRAFIKEVLNRHDIEMPFPQMVIHNRTEKGEE